MIYLKNTDEPPSRSDGRRLLIDASWPRGVVESELRVDAWMKELAPSTALVRWFDDRIDRFDEFQDRYQAQLDGAREYWEPLVLASRGTTITLLHSPRAAAHTSALVLLEYLLDERRNDRASGGRDRDIAASSAATALAP